MNKAIQKMFEPLAGRYELVNHAVTFGLDTVWRKKAAGIAVRDARKGCGCAQVRGAPAPCGATAPGVSPESRVWLDVSTGTGEMAELLNRLADARTSVLASDFSMPMLGEAARKFAAHQAPVGGKAKDGPVARTRRILLVAADDCHLPWRDDSLDLITISLGTRNLNTSRDALVSCFREFHRVLRPGGRFVNLETSQPRSRLVRLLFHGYVRGFVRPAASALSGNGAAYAYLASSMCSFYEADELAAAVREAGFARVEAKTLLLGVAAIHVAEK
jgi:demethylmenaquinone methyltransferase/2-methoxy-6-polyprenyl-1,4-benzoquinol methylase